MKSVENQRIIKVRRYSETARKDFYKVSNKNLITSMYNLSGNELKLYIYLSMNMDGYTLALYPCDFEKVANVSYDTYKRSFQKLIDKGFIIPTNKKNYYIFTEESIKKDLPYPKKDMIESVNEKDFEYDLEEALQRIKAKEKENNDT